jgi:transposase
MTVDLKQVRIFIRPGYTDLRKAVNGLVLEVQEQMKQDPFGGSVFIFCNRERKLLKALWWDNTGYWLCQKRLEKERWPWPGNEEEARELNGEEVHMLLKGIDFWKAHKGVPYKKVN